MIIGGIECGQLILGPMAGFSDKTFRALCKEQGASLTYTEMVSAKALYYKNKNTYPLLAVDEPGPVAAQLFGNDPELLADEALKLEEGPFAFFDVNMGCPVPKVVNNGEGSSLMRDPEKVYAIVSTMTKKLHKPVTVKIRKGFNKNEINAVEIAKIAEDAGASAVAIHGRLREEYYSGSADWDIIRQVKESVAIPVIGSGDIFRADDAKRMLSETGCDAVMIARGARGNPWIFSQIREFLETGKEPEKPDIDEVKRMIMRHLTMLMDFEGEVMAIPQMRKHVGFYCAGYPQATHLRREINRCSTLSEFEETLARWGDNCLN